MDFTLRSPYTFEGLEAWQAALPLTGDAYARKLGERAFRDAVREEIARPEHFRLFNGEWDKVQVVESARPHVEQRSIAALAAEARRDPLDCMLDLALAENLETVFSALLLNSDEAAVGRMLRDPHALVSLSASPRPLVARARRAVAGRSRAAPHQPSGRDLRHPRARRAEDRQLRRPAAV
jgi:N-acyl-D-aspartate/D-glutamate deacylase